MTDYQPAQPRIVRFPEAAPPAHPCIELAPDWTYTVVNEAALADLGKPREALIGHVLWEVWPGFEETPCGRSLRHVMETREPYIARQGGLQPWRDLFTDITPIAGGGIRVVYRHAVAGGRVRRVAGQFAGWLLPLLVMAA